MTTADVWIAELEVEPPSPTAVADYLATWSTADLRRYLDTLAASGTKLPQSQLDELQATILLDHAPRYTDLLTARLRLLK
jgi:hypothetical protein